MTSTVVGILGVNIPTKNATDMFGLSASRIRACIQEQKEAVFDKAKQGPFQTMQMAPTHRGSVSHEEEVTHTHTHAHTRTQADSTTLMTTHTLIRPKRTYTIRQHNPNDHTTLIRPLAGVGSSNYTPRGRVTTVRLLGW
jgi:hypothetical protein